MDDARGFVRARARARGVVAATAREAIVVAMFFAFDPATGAKGTRARVCGARCRDARLRAIQSAATATRRRRVIKHREMHH